jgi:hypothetical protein
MLPYADYKYLVGHLDSFVSLCVNDPSSYKANLTRGFLSKERLCQL